MLIILLTFLVYLLAADILSYRKVLEQGSAVTTSPISSVINFFDVLGIKAFAPQTALLKFTKQTEDRLLPGNLKAANTIPVLIQALIFMRIVEVEAITLQSATAGAVARLPVKNIQLIMGVALLVTAFYILEGRSAQSEKHNPAQEKAGTA